MFMKISGPALGPTQPPTQWVHIFFFPRVGKAAGGGGGGEFNHSLNLIWSPEAARYQDVN
jgi:hypothetical protein